MIGESTQSRPAHALWVLNFSFTSRRSFSSPRPPGRPPLRRTIASRRLERKYCCRRGRAVERYLREVCREEGAPQLSCTFLLCGYTVMCFCALRVVWKEGRDDRNVSSEACDRMSSPLVRFPTPIGGRLGPAPVWDGMQTTRRVEKDFA